MFRAVMFAVLALSSVVPAPGAHAGMATAWNEHPNARVRLVAGEGRYLGVEVVLARGWKTYWRMPGDAGVPPTFDVTASTNLGPSEVLYPVPSAFPEAGGTAVGYMGTVTFPIRYVPVDPTKPVFVRLMFSFGVCKDVCIPLESVLALDLPADPTDLGAAPQIAAALARVPRVLEDASQTIPALTASTIKLTGAEPYLRLETRGALNLFVEAPDGLFLPQPHRTQGAADTATFAINLSQSPDLKELVGKPLRVTLTTSTGGIETTLHLVERR